MQYKEFVMVVLIANCYDWLVFLCAFNQIYVYLLGNN
jgi:hypothetical protein